MWGLCWTARGTIGLLPGKNRMKRGEVDSEGQGNQIGVHWTLNLVYNKRVFQIETSA